jgi:5,10-methylenetetrahydromethanopterin reductase
MAMEVGVVLVAPPKRTAALASTAEEMGFASLRFPDSQNLAPEVWGQLMLAAAATTRIQLGPGVTNSVTRDPALTASSALALQVESDGRAVLGIGRGDSSVQRIGREPDAVANFERYLRMVRAYLAGEAVDRDGFASRLEWLPHVKVPTVPIEVACTGPRVIAVAARHADRICFAVGADPEHLSAAIAHARQAAAAAGRDPDALRYGAFVNCVLHDDVAVARDALRGTVATFARFSAMRGSKLAQLPAPLRRTAEYIRGHYDMREHTRAAAAHTAGIDDAFVDWFAIAGPVARALPRFRQLAALGLDFLHVVPSSTGVAREIAIGSFTRLGSELLPALQAAG